MIRYLFHPDAGTIAANAVFTVGSMGLSGYCGWLIADGQIDIIRACTAGMFSMIAFGLSLMIVRRERYKASRDAAGYDRTKFAVIALLIANIMTDYSASAALRNVTMTRADNINTTAANARSEVVRLEKRIADLQGEKAWRTKFEAPESYAALIDKQKQVTDRGANVFARTKQCTDTTLPISQAVCQTIKQLEADKANAERRQIVLAEMKTLGDQLAVAKANAKDNGKVGNAALAPIVQLVQIVTQSLDNEETEVQWGLNYFVLLMTLFFNAGIYYFSAELGSRMGPMSAPVSYDHYQPRRKPQNRWLEAPEGHEPEPIPLKAEPVPDKHGTTSSTKVTVNTYGQSHDKDAIARLMKELEEDFGLTPKH